MDIRGTGFLPGRRRFCRSVSKISPLFFLLEGPLDLLSEDVQLNGRLLAINDKLQFPDIVPVVLHPAQPLILKPHGAVFFVFADYRAPACTATF